MDAGLAHTIIDNYGRVLEETSSITSGVPESFLPYDKNLIKQAIKAIWQQLSPKDVEKRNFLETGYMCLANFIPIHEAQITAKYQEAIKSGDPNHVNWQYGDLAMKIFDEITNDMNTLSIEIKNSAV